MLGAHLRCLEALSGRLAVFQHPARHRRIFRLFRKFDALHRGEHLIHQFENALFCRLICSQYLSRNTAALANQAEKQMLGSDVAVVQFLSCAVRILQRFLRLFGKIICHKNSFLLPVCAVSALEQLG